MPGLPQRQAITVSKLLRLAASLTLVPARPAAATPPRSRSAARLAPAAMADHKELEADLFGSSSDDEGPPPADGGSDGEAQPQADAKATTAALFGSSDEEEEQPGPSHPVTAALGEDEDEYEAGRWVASCAPVVAARCFVAA